MNKEILISLFLFFLSIVWDVYNLKRLKKSDHTLKAGPLDIKTYFRFSFGIGYMSHNSHTNFLPIFTYFIK